MAFEIFFRKAANNFTGKIGEERTQNIFDSIRDPFKLIPEEYNDMASEISKFLFTFSQGIENLKPERIEGALNHVLFFTSALSELNRSRVEVNDDILKRSNNGMRGLVGLLQGFVNKAIEGNILEELINFEDILTFTLGEKSEPPKTVEKTLPIHVQMTPLLEEFPVAKEHHLRVTALSSIMGQYLTSLKSEDSEKIVNQMREGTIPEDLVFEEFSKEIAELPKTNENLFLNRTLELLKKEQVLKDDALDRAVTGAVALKIFEKVFTDTVNGKNALVRATKLRKLLRDRKEKDLEERRRLDENIKNLIEEDFASVKQKSLIFKDTISILNRKGIYIDVFTYLKDHFSEDILKDFTGMDPLQHIGCEYVDVMTYSDLVKLFDLWTEKMKTCITVIETFVRESSSATPPDAKEKVEAILNFFDALKELNENIGTDRLYGRRVQLAGNSVLLAFLQYAYEFVDDVLWMIEKVHEMSILPMPRFLSKAEEDETEVQIRTIEGKLKNAQNQGIPEDAPMVRKLKESLERRKSAADKFKVMANLLEESIKALERLKSMKEFGIPLSELLSRAAAVHRNLPGALIKHLEMPGNFKLEIDHFINTMREAMISAVMPKNDFEKRSEAAEKLKKFLSKLCENKNFMENMRGMSIIYSFKDSNT